jgi:hypothetical protein
MSVLDVEADLDLARGGRPKPAGARRRTDLHAQGQRLGGAREQRVQQAGLLQARGGQHALLRVQAHQVHALGPVLQPAAPVLRRRRRVGPDQKRARRHVAPARSGLGGQRRGRAQQTAHGAPFGQGVSDDGRGAAHQAVAPVGRLTRPLQALRIEPEGLGWRQGGRRCGRCRRGVVERLRPGRALLVAGRQVDRPITRNRPRARHAAQRQPPHRPKPKPHDGRPNWK